MLLDNFLVASEEKRSERFVKWIPLLFFTLTNDQSSPVDTPVTGTTRDFLREEPQKIPNKRGVGANDTMSELNLCRPTLGAAIENKFCLKKGVRGHVGETDRTKAVVG